MRVKWLINSHNRGRRKITYNTVSRYTGLIRTNNKLLTQRRRLLDKRVQSLNGDFINFTNSPFSVDVSVTNN